MIFIDTKKKENIGNFSAKGQEYQPKGQPVETNMHAPNRYCPDKKSGKVVPYGIYDLLHNKGFANVGISSDTAQFAVNLIRVW